MPELILEIGGRVFEVACEAGQEPSLERAAKLLDAQATAIAGSDAASTEKRMLLLAGLMQADSTATLKDEIEVLQENLKMAEERIRIAEAKSAMLAANALKSDASVSNAGTGQELEQLRAENDAAVELLSRVLSDINALAEAAEQGVS